MVAESVAVVVVVVVAVVAWLLSRMVNRRMVKRSQLTLARHFRYSQTKGLGARQDAGLE